jgi:hypothetical protein
MGTPFRSDVEVVREQLRRAEESLQALSDENAELARAGNVRGRTRARTALVAAGIGAIFAVGCLVGGLVGAARAAATGALRERELAATIRSSKESLASAQADAFTASLEHDRRYADCQRELAVCRSTDLGLIPACTPTNCTGGDPLCNRNLMRAFDSFFFGTYDSIGTSDELHSIERALMRCLTPPRPLGLRVLVAVAPDEHVGSNAPLTADETKCAVRTLHDMHLETFDGIRRSNP